MTVKWTQIVLTACCFATFGTGKSSTAQVTPSANETVTVSDDSTTWIRPATGNAVDIPAGADGVVVNNGIGGQINGDPNGVITAAETTVNNQGNLTGVVNGVNFVNGQGSGVLNNTAPGVVSSDSRAVNIGGTVAITNSGSIIGTGDQRNGTVYSNVSANNFSIDNRGLIDAGEANQGAGFSAELASSGTDFTLDNSGGLAGRGNSAAGAATAGDGIRLERTRVGGALDGSTTGLFTGEISNSGAVISEGANGTVAGLRVVNGVSFQGELNNFGLIDGTQNGVYFGNPTPAGGGDHTGGVVNNSGVISSASRALNIDGIGLVVNNSADIIGRGDQRNGTVYADSTAQDFTLNNQSAGIIDAGIGNQGAGFSAELDELGNDFDIVNAGQITGRGNAAAGLATAGDGIRLERSRVGGVLEGSTTGLFTGEISNSGSITSEAANGTVGAIRVVNGVSFQGELNNRGVIAGVQNGLYFGNPTPAGGGNHSGGVVNNSGVISSDSRALNIDGLGLEINNQGAILGTGDQRNGTVYADSTAQDFTLNNQGLIDAGEGNLGAGFSAELADTGNSYTINNSGQILGRGNAAAGLATAGDGIRLERSRVGGVLEGSTTGLFTGEINNSGTITSEAANGTVGGIRVVNGVSFQGVLNNSGTIAGVQNGVYFGNPTPAGGGNHTDGVVNNTGVISSDSRAFNVDGNGLTVNNFGDILATGRQRNGTFYVDGTADLFTLNNAGRIDASGGAGSGVSIQVGSFAGDEQSGTLINSGSIIGSGDQDVDAGVRLFTNNPTAIFSGDIINDVNGLIAAEGAGPAVLVQEGVDFNGALINSGTIDGAVSLASGDAFLSDTSTLVLDIAAAHENDFETFSVGGLLSFGGTLELNFQENFFPTIGDSFDLFDFVAADGTFDEIVAAGVVFDTSRLLVDGSLSVSGVNVPEPSAYALLTLAGCMMTSISRRRR